MKIVVDSNIVFSAILNSQGKIGQLLIFGEKYFEFFTVGLLKSEIQKHKEKILSISKYTEEQFNVAYQTVISRIKFVDDVVLSDKEIDEAVRMVSGIDINDTLFVALANNLNCNLWTGDRKLSEGLNRKKFDRIIDTNELYEIFLINKLNESLKKK